MSYQCWSCKQVFDNQEREDGEHFSCSQCGEINYINGTRTMDRDEYHESVCDSLTSARYEESAYGRDDDRDFIVSDTPSAFTDSRWDD